MAILREAGRWVGNRIPFRRIRGMRTGMPTLMLAFAVSACGDDGTEPETAVLVVSPDTIVLTESAPTNSLFLSTTGKAGRAWQVSAKPDWVTVDPNSGTLGAGINEVHVTGHLEGLTTENTYGAIHVISEIGTARSTVRAVVNLYPLLEIDIDSLYFAGSVETIAFTVRNAGRSSLFWSATPSDPWLTLTPHTSTIAGSGEGVEVLASVDRDPLPVGESVSSLTFVANDRRPSRTLPVVAEVFPSPEGTLSSVQLKFSGTVTEKKLTMENTGKGVLEWTVATAPPWVSLNPDGGIVEEGDSASIAVSVDRVVAGPGTVTGTVQLATNAASSPSFAVVVSDEPPYPFGLIGLGHQVLDAEYDLAGDRIVTVSLDPPTLHVLDVDFGTSRSVSLPVPPTAVAVQPDGGLAAVGHDAFISIVDLNAMELKATLPVTADVLDIVLPGNGWVYALPKRDQWEQIRCVEIATGAETLGSGLVYAGTLARLHPSRKFIYAADNGLSPSDIEKHDIRSGPSRRLYDSPYHGDFSFAGNVWISEDGRRLYARSGTVFTASEEQDEDMLYAGRFATLGSIQWAVSSTDRERVFVLSEAFPESLWIHESGFLTLLGAVNFPLFPTSGASVPSEGRFAFVHSDDTRVFVLVQARAGGGNVGDWGLLVLDANLIF